MNNVWYFALLAQLDRAPDFYVVETSGRRGFEPRSRRLPRSRFLNRLHASAESKQRQNQEESERKQKAADRGDRSVVISAFYLLRTIPTQEAS